MRSGHRWKYILIWQTAVLRHVLLDSFLHCKMTVLRCCFELSWKSERALAFSLGTAFGLVLMSMSYCRQQQCIEQHIEGFSFCIQAYKNLRIDGENDMVSILLGVNTQLMEFDFRETFVDSFAVSIKNLNSILPCLE